MDDMLVWKVTLSASVQKINFPRILEQAPLSTLSYWILFAKIQIWQYSTCQKIIPQTPSNKQINIWTLVTLNNVWIYKTKSGNTQSVHLSRACTSWSRSIWDGTCPQVLCIFFARWDRKTHTLIGVTMTGTQGNHKCFFPTSTTWPPEHRVNSKKYIPANTPIITLLTSQGVFAASFRRPPGHRLCCVSHLSPSFLPTVFLFIRFSAQLSKFVC